MNQADVPKIPMTELNCDLAVAQAIALIKSYSFDTNGNPAEKLVQKWLNNYQGHWVRLAAIEALYLGRYKSVSIEQIMAAWFRIGTPNIHFKGEFERLICRKLPKHLVMSDTFWLATDESLFNGLKENSNSDHLQYNQSRTSDKYHFPERSTTITNFHPILDNSSFFDKLKSLALANI